MGPEAHEILDVTPDKAANEGGSVIQITTTPLGETPIVPPMAAIANAIEQAIGIRFNELPMTPPKVLAAIEASGGPVAEAAE